MSSRSSRPSTHKHPPARCPYEQFGRTARGEYLIPESAIPKQVKLIGDGQVGGKARGLIFVMDYLEKGGRLTRYDEFIRFADCVVITTDVFDAFIEGNRLEEAVSAGCEEKIALEALRERCVSAEFPQDVRRDLSRFLRDEHRPLVVRSSSVMEDDTEHSFAGIYLSEFLNNTGPLERRLDQLITVIKRIYASTFGPDAHAYRKRHHLPWQREKMGILIQNMIGQHDTHRLYYPLIGGVAFSLNFYPWSDRLRPEDGIVRLVIGVGTRAVGREYARVFSPSLPSLRPEGADPRTIVRYSQEIVDVLDMRKDGLRQRKLHELDNALLRKVCSVVTPDNALLEPVSGLLSGGRYVASFNRLIETDALMPFTSIVQDLFSSLSDLLDHPVDLEFAVDFPPPEASSQPPLFYLLQVRPLGGRAEHRRIRLPEAPMERTLLLCNQVLGNGRQREIHDLVFVDPLGYDAASAYEIARQIGRINQELDDRPYILVGPGRWGTSTPTLGVPVRYNEISGAAVIVEMSTESFAPELSYGTHFYADMVTSGILYLPLREEKGDYLNRGLLSRQEVRFSNPFIKHVHFAQPLDVYVDGKGGKGLITVHKK